MAMLKFLSHKASTKLLSHSPPSVISHKVIYYHHLEVIALNSQARGKGMEMGSGF